jgi:hypothetical protein
MAAPPGTPQTACAHASPPRASRATHLSMPVSRTPAIVTGTGVPEPRLPLDCA